MVGARTSNGPPPPPPLLTPPALVPARVATPSASVAMMTGNDCDVPTPGGVEAAAYDVRLFAIGFEIYIAEEQAVAEEKKNHVDRPTTGKVTESRGSPRNATTNSINTTITTQPLEVVVPPGWVAATWKCFWRTAVVPKTERRPSRRPHR